MFAPCCQAEQRSSTAKGDLYAGVYVCMCVDICVYIHVYACPHHAAKPGRRLYSDAKMSIYMCTCSSETCLCICVCACANCSR